MNLLFVIGSISLIIILVFIAYVSYEIKFYEKFLAEQIEKNKKDL